MSKQGKGKLGRVFKLVAVRSFFRIGSSGGVTVPLSFAPTLGWVPGKTKLFVNVKPGLITLREATPEEVKKYRNVKKSEKADQ